MHTMSDKITEFTYVTRQKYGSDSFAAGYLSSMVDEMIREMRIRGTQEMKEMANHHAVHHHHADGEVKMTTFNDIRSPRQKLQDAYIERIIDGLDWGDLWQYAYDKLSEEMDEYSDEGLTQQVKDVYPDLLENQ